MFFARHLFFSFFLFALAEAVLLAKVGTAIGWGITIALIVLTAFIGSIMFRQQGFLTLTRLNQRMANGELPGQEMVEGVLILMGGVMLMTPGFLTDALGFICLISGTRRLLAAWMIRKGIMQAVMPGNGQGQGQVWMYRETWQQGNVYEHQGDASQSSPDHHPQTGPAPRSGELIEGDFQPVRKPDDPA